MRNKIIAIILLLVSIFLVITSLTSLKSYNLIKNGNNFIVNEKYQEGREMYEKALTIEKNSGIKLNILKSFYQEKNYEEVVKSEVEDGFLKGNSYAYLGDKSQDKNKEFYEKALEEYKLAMKKSKDINIKKNYEIVLKKLEDTKNQENQEEKQKDENQNKQNNKENNNSDKNNKQNNDSKNNNQDNKENSSSESNQNKSQNNEKDSEKNNENNANNNSEQNQNNSSNDDNREEKQNNNSDTEKKENEQNSTPSKDIKEASQDEIREQEVKAILKRLEGNEKQSFKNNERVMNINNNNPSNRW